MPAYYDSREWKNSPAPRRRGSSFGCSRPKAVYRWAGDVDGRHHASDFIALGALRATSSRCVARFAICIHARRLRIGTGINSRSRSGRAPRNPRIDQCCNQPASRRDIVQSRPRPLSESRYGSHHLAWTFQKSSPMRSRELKIAGRRMLLIARSCRILGAVSRKKK